MPVRNAGIGDDRLVQQRIAFTGFGTPEAPKLPPSETAGIETDFIGEVAIGLAFDAEIGAAHHGARAEVGGTGEAGAGDLALVLVVAGKVQLEAGAEGQGEAAVTRSKGRAAIVEIPDRGIVALFQGRKTGAVSGGAIDLGGLRVFQRLDAGGEFGIADALAAGLRQILRQDQIGNLGRVVVGFGGLRAGGGGHGDDGHARHQCPDFHYPQSLVDPRNFAQRCYRRGALQDDDGSMTEM